jgi:hypothetical protein
VSRRSEPPRKVAPRQGDAITPGMSLSREVQLLEQIASDMKEHSGTLTRLAESLDYSDRIAPVPDEKRAELARSLRAAADEAVQLYEWLDGEAIRRARK